MIVDLHLADTPAAIARLAADAALLDADERTRARRCRRPADRELYTAAHVLLRLALSRESPVPAPDWRFRRDPGGRPEIDLARCPAGAGLRFNLSHSRDLMCCAVSRDLPVGVDAERHRQRLDPLALARRFFCDGEAALLAAAPEAARVALFHALWTLKEAHLKALGLGIAKGLHRLCFDLAAGAPGLIRVTDHQAPARPWRAALFGPADGAWTLAVALPAAADLHLRVHPPATPPHLLAATPGLAVGDEPARR